MTHKEPYHDLVTWQRADEFVQLVYQATKLFPAEEKYGIVSQFRRAAVSIPLNIVEGHARGSTKDYIRFLYTSQGSVNECAYLIELSVKLGYIDEEDFEILYKKKQEVNFLLQRLIRGLKIKIQTRQSRQSPQSH